MALEQYYDIFFKSYEKRLTNVVDGVIMAM